MNWIKSVKEIIGGIILAIAIPILIILIMATMVVTTTFPLMELSPNKILIGYFIGIAICILMILGAYFLLREKEEEKTKRFKLRSRYFWIAVLLYNFGIHGAVGAYEFFREYPLTFFLYPLILFLICKLGIYLWYKFYDHVIKKPESN